MENSRLSKHWRNVGSTDNLAELSKLDENIILDELKARYDKDKIYTYVGDILIAVNPFKDLPIYDKQVSANYSSENKLHQNAPHIYAVASHVYTCMLGLEYDAGPRDQCIVISGESGAGKTESTKLVVKQIIELCNGNTQLEQQILQVNPLLEAFGNAKTVINGNSSRFGKYIQLLFSCEQARPTVVGAKISEYLLEKSRVVHQNAGDANFHIFSYLFAGCSPEQKQTFRLRSQNSYRYTQIGDRSTADVSYLRSKFEELQNAMDIVGFSEEEQDNLMCILSGVLTIGNVNFAPSADESRVSITYPEDSETAAELFGVNPVDLTACLISRLNKTRGEQILIHLTKQQAGDSRDAVAKVIYGRLFSWIVNKINQRLAPQFNTQTEQTEIGILDIFGFENFASNSFEQACINLANEHLQFFFNEHIFNLEQEEYRTEGIKWNNISYADNQPLLDLFLKRPIGLLALLDEESHFPKATDATFVRKLCDNLSSCDCFKSHCAVGTKPTFTPTFTIRHYAGEVTYDVKNWLEKNRDTIPPTLMSILKHSQNELLRTIFKGAITRTGTLALQNRTRKSLANKQAAPISNTRKLTVGTQFKNSLQELIKHMDRADPHFIRCLKPNSHQKPSIFDDKYVLSQLSYTGMLQTVHIRRDGYAFRPLIPDFIATYKLLLFHQDVPVDAETCKQILHRAEVTDWRVGKTKVFLKYQHGDMLARKLSILVNAVIRLQAVVRGALARRYARQIREISLQQKAYIESFLHSTHLKGEDFRAQQAALLSHDKEEWEEKLRREHKETQLREIAAKAAATAAEAQKRESALREKEEAEARRLSVNMRSQLVPLPAPPSPQGPPPQLPPQLPTQPPPHIGISPTRERPTPRSSRDSIALRRKQYSETKSVVIKFSKYGNCDEEDEVIEDDFSKALRTERASNPYGPAGSKMATIEWFRKSQLPKLLKPHSEGLHDWFHGMIPRGKAEMLLKTVGSFMIRLSDKRLGFVLSFRGSTRCRHYMVDPTPSNKYVIVGEPKVHKTLSDLVEYYKQIHISNWNGLLIAPCGQADHHRPDYQELLPSTAELSTLRNGANKQAPTRESWAPPLQHTPQPASRASSAYAILPGSQSSAPPLPPKLHPKTKETPKYISYK